jgi:hypothetical protein
MRSAWRRISATGALQITVERGVLTQRLQISADHGEWRAQFVRRIRHEVTTHRFEAHLARDIAHQQKLLAVAVRNDLQRQVAVSTPVVGRMTTGFE